MTNWKSIFSIVLSFITINDQFQPILSEIVSSNILLNQIYINVLITNIKIVFVYLQYQFIIFVFNSLAFNHTSENNLLQLQNQELFDASTSQPNDNLTQITDDLSNEDSYHKPHSRPKRCKLIMKHFTILKYNAIWLCLYINLW